MVKRKASCLSFDSAEDLPIDLIFHMLHGNVGLYTFLRARQVNRAWAAACDDEKLIVSVAHYTDGLTRSQFRGLLRLTKEQATTFPSRPCRNAGSLNTLMRRTFSARRCRHSSRSASSRQCRERVDGSSGGGFHGSMGLRACSARSPPIWASAFCTVAGKYR